MLFPSADAPWSTSMKMKAARCPMDASVSRRGDAGIATSSAVFRSPAF